MGHQFIHFGALATAVVAGLLGSQPTSAASVVANGRARTWKPITVTNTRPLDFGTMVVGPTAGQVVINPRTDARSRTGGVTLAGGAPGAARFIVTGTRAVNALITIGTAPLLTRVSGTETMTVSNMTLNGGRTRRFPASGVLDVRVGGRLNVAANQRDGLYSGVFSLTIDYP